MFKGFVFCCCILTAGAMLTFAAPVANLTISPAFADDDDGGGGGKVGRGSKLLRIPNLTNPCRGALGVVGGLTGLTGIRGMPCGPRARRRAKAVQPKLVRREELIATGLTQADLGRLTRLGFDVLSSRESRLLNRSVARLRVPRNRNFASAIRLAASTAPDADFAKNDLYKRTAQETYKTAGKGCAERCESFEITGWTREIGRCSAETLIGVIDTGVDRDHPSLISTPLKTQTVRRDDKPASGRQHGTAVVSLLGGSPDSQMSGMAPGARIFAADAFYSDGKTDVADAYDIIAAFDWLQSEGVQIINVSLSGPDNSVLQETISRVVASGGIIIAAAGEPVLGGNTGYPGRYDGVIAVSAVDVRLRPSRLAARGAHIEFAAPGVGVVVAASGGGYQLVDGTSFATPFITAAYAIGRRDAPKRDDLTAVLSRTARDLGAPGHDPVFGWGLVQYGGLPKC